MQNKLYFISILFVALVSLGGFFAVADTADAFFTDSYCSNCGSYDTYYYPDSYYYPDYSSGYDDYYYYPNYNYGYDSYYDYYEYYDYSYYQPTFYVPPTVVNPPTQPTPPTCTLATTRTNVTAGTPVTISWTASKATSGNITNIGSVSPNFGSRSVTPQVTTTYTGTFSGQGGSTTCQTTVVVQPKAPPTCSLIASPGSINQGDSASLNWTTTGDATSMTITNIGNVNTGNGSRTVTPGSSTTYVGTVSGQGGTATCQATVLVASNPLPVTPPSCTLSITQNNFNNNFNNPATIFWTTNNATSINISNIGTVSTGSGSRTIFPGQGTQTYVATVNGPGGSATCQATTQNIVQPAPWCTLSVSSNVVSGNPTTLTWNTSSNANSFFISNIGTVNTGSGSRTIFPNSTITYTGTVTNFNGRTATCQTTVGVTGGPNVSLFQQPGDQPLAFVSLSQVPYTGFEAGTALTFLFWFAVALWSFGLAYIFVGKQGIQFVAERVFAFDTSVGAYQSVAVDDEAPSTREDEYVNGHTYIEPVLQSQMTVPAQDTAPTTSYDEPVVAAAPTTDTVSSLQEVIEARAHASGVLMSPEAVESALKLREDREETLKVFGEILNEAVRTLPREDGWILFSSDRFDDLASQYKTDGEDTQPEINKDDLAV